MKKIFAILLTLSLLIPQFAQATTEDVTVDPDPSKYNLQWVSQSDYPVLQPNEIATIWVKFKNTGSASWYNYGSHPTRLGTSHLKDRSSAFYKHTWPSSNRAANMKETGVAPGQIGTFEFYIKAPETPGVYNEYFQPVVEGITWMPDLGVFWKMTVDGNSSNNESQNNTSVSSDGYHSAWSSQSPYLTLDPGEIQTVWVKFKNTGSETWYNSGDHPVRIGTDHPSDRSSLFYKYTWLSTNRPTNLKEASVAPGQIGTFEFYVKAPDTSGEYKEYFRPLVEGVTWMEDWGVYWTFIVNGTESNNDNDNSNSNINLSYTAQSNGIKLNWNQYSSNISGYKIVRSETNSNPTYPNDWWVYAPGSSSTSYVDTSAVSGHSYYYRVGAYDSNSGVVSYSNNIYASYTGSSNNNNTSFTLTGNTQSNGNRLSWNKYTNSSISGYKVVRSETKSNPTYPDDWWIYVSDINTLDYLDTSAINGKSYYYRVGAYNSDSGIVEYSNYVYLTTNNSNSNNTDSNFKLSGSNYSDGIHLAWNKYTSSDIDGYKVVRSESDSNPTYPDDWWIYLSNDETTNYVDSSTVSGHSYYYRIGAYKSGSVIAYSNNIYVSDGTSYNNNEDFTLEGNAQSTGIRLDWNTYYDQDVDGYKILRSVSDSSPTYPDNYLVYVSGQDSDYYLDQTPTDGYGYYYRIGAYNDGSVVAYSNTVYVTYNGTDNNSNGTFYLSGYEEGKTIRLSWNTYDNDDIDGYKLLRSETNSSPTYPPYYKYISGQDSTGYVDSSVTDGHGYYYRLGAYQNGNVIAYSNTVYINK